MIGSRIKAMRLARRLSLTELARRAGVSKSFVSQVERGQANPSVDTMRELARALEVPLFSLFLEEHDPKSALVRKEERVTISLAGSDAIRQLLTTDINRDMVLVYSRLCPQGKSSPSPVVHQGKNARMCWQEPSFRRSESRSIHCTRATASISMRESLI